MPPSVTCDPFTFKDTQNFTLSQKTTFELALHLPRSVTLSVSQQKIKTVKTSPDPSSSARARPTLLRNSFCSFLRGSPIILRPLRPQAQGLLGWSEPSRVPHPASPPPPILHPGHRPGPRPPPSPPVPAPPLPQQRTSAGLAGLWRRDARALAAAQTACAPTGGKERRTSPQAARVRLLAELTRSARSLNRCPRPPAESPKPESTWTESSGQTWEIFRDATRGGL